ncbi:hypothetical protein AZI86_11035 [Bdellovibrio bacteriovorus]|uniref:Uncharacterized protein n=1 Tax=Bdellovibrio bacteriovorus TaxID=959 RepID=A0A150WLM6_BDEBC|nr:MBOAT family O-acyltransferase [Bdellovibrio bacteriovorus]KYG64735.1 hypothetical protein AZI86_11035 [Bdellovibrio bacteriovorus]
MNLFLNPTFWICIIGCGVFLRSFSNLSLKIWLTGLVNFALLWVFLGWKEALFLLLLSTVLFFSARMVEKLPRISIFLPMALVIFFCVYKLLSLAQEKSLWNALLIIPYSYIFLRAIDAFNILKVKKTRHDTLNFAFLLSYLMPINMHFAGPIAPFKKFCESFSERDPCENFSGVLNAINLLVTGFFYKLFCAEVVRIIYFGNGDIVSKTVLDTGVIFIYTFFDFAGYTLIAMGAGRILGLYTPENFRSPFSAPSVSSFYNRWHMSLGDWIRRNIYFPMQMKYTRSKRRTVEQLLYFNAFVLFVSFVFIGAWHGFHFRFLVWGILLGIIITVEKFAFDLIKKKGWDKNNYVVIVWKLLGPVYTFIMISLAIHPAMNLMLGK